MRVVAIGDVGVIDDMMHIGDEAMFEALVDELRPRGASEIVALSAAPADTADRYGVGAVQRIGFGGDRAEMTARLDAVRGFLAGRDTVAADDPLRSVVTAVQEADAVVIAGGGNMASTWPMHIFERAALGLIAARYDRPLVITGQTFGPHLEAEDRDLLGALLRSAQLVGVRERASEIIARDLGVDAARLHAGRDDASFLGVVDSLAVDTASPGPLLVSLSGYLGSLARPAAVAGLGRAFDELAAEVEASVVFHPHFGALTPGVRAGDEVLHAEVAAAMRTPAELLEPGTPREAAALARSAAMLVTSRYHPAVFATPAGMPVAALTVDGYTAVKLGGATGWWGRENAVIPLAEAVGAGGGAELKAVWSTRAATRRQSSDRLADARREATAWWDRVADTLAG